MADPQLPSSHPIGNLLEQEEFLSIIKYYVDLNCLVLTLGPVREWVALHRTRRPATLGNLEMKYRMVRKLDEASNPHFRRALREGRPVLGPYLDLDFHDHFQPVLSRGGCVGMLISGTFVLEEWTRPALERNWARISGKAASHEDPDYLEFVRIALDTPVLKDEVLGAYQEALGCLSRLLGGEGGMKEAGRLRELKLRVFSKRFPHRSWMDWALGNQYVMPLWGKKVAALDWVQQEIGITRIPTTAITVIPVKSAGGKPDPVGEMIRVRKLQREGFHFAKTLPQTVGGELENYGAVFVTSADPSKNRLQRRKQIEETAKRVHGLAVEVLGGPALVGVGETMAPGESLNRSYRQAVLALHLGSHSGKGLVFFTQGRQAKAEGIPELRRLLSGLAKQFVSSSFSDLEIARDSFLKQVLILSFRNPEEIRWHFQYAVIQLVEAVRRQVEVPSREITDLHEGMSLALEKAGTTQEMVQAFQEALRKLAQYTARPESVKAAGSVERARDYIQAHFQEPLRVVHLAKMAKVSPATFSRRFKRLSGIGLENYLLDLRLEEARRLLKAGGLPIAKVSRQCGFRSVPHFIHVFRKKNGTTPQKFRMKFLGS